MNNAISMTKTNSPKRDVSMVELEIDCVTSQCLPNGWLANPGVSRIFVYADEVAQVEALTRTEEDNELYRQAEVQYAKRFAKWAENNCGGDMEKAAALCPLSVESVYLSMNEGDGVFHIKPIKSMTVIRKDLPPPEEKKSWEAQSKSAGMVADVIEKLLTNDALIDLVAEAVSKRGSESAKSGKKGN